MINTAISKRIKLSAEKGKILKAADGTEGTVIYLGKGRTIEEFTEVDEPKEETIEIK